MSMKASNLSDALEELVDEIDIDESMVLLRKNKLESVEQLHNLHRGLTIAIGGEDPDDTWYEWCKGVVSEAIDITEAHKYDDEFISCGVMMIEVVEFAIASYHLYATKACVWTALGKRFYADELKSDMEAMYSE